MHDQSPVNEVKTVRLGLVRVIDHIVHCHNKGQEESELQGREIGYSLLIYKMVGNIEHDQRQRDLLSFSPRAGRLYTASQVFTLPGMQKTNSKSKLLINWELVKGKIIITN